VPGDHAFDVVQVALEARRVALLVLVVAVVAELVGIEGVVVDQARAAILYQAHVGTGRSARRRRIGEGAVLQHRQAGGAV
jgi:hypothetical protein